MAEPLRDVGPRAARCGVARGDLNHVSPKHVVEGAGTTSDGCRLPRYKILQVRQWKMRGKTSQASFRAEPLARVGREWLCGTLIRIATGSEVWGRIPSLRWPGMGPRSSRKRATQIASADSQFGNSLNPRTEDPFWEGCDLSAKRSHSRGDVNV